MTPRDERRIRQIEEEKRMVNPIDPWPAPPQDARNCRNCGAPPNGTARCAYCGTVDAIPKDAVIERPMPAPRVPMEKLLFTPTPGERMLV